jgi:hypothetical protein
MKAFAQSSFKRAANQAAYWIANALRMRVVKGKDGESYVHLARGRRFVAQKDGGMKTLYQGPIVKAQDFITALKEADLTGKLAVKANMVVQHIEAAIAPPAPKMAVARSVKRTGPTQGARGRTH